MEFNEDHIRDLSIFLIGGNSPPLTDTPYLIRKGKTYNFFYSASLAFNKKIHDHKNINFEESYNSIIEKLIDLKESFESKNTLKIESLLQHLVNDRYHINLLSEIINGKAQLLDCLNIRDSLSFFESQNIIDGILVKKIKDEYSSLTNNNVDENIRLYQNISNDFDSVSNFIREASRELSHSHENKVFAMYDRFISSIDNCIKNKIDINKVFSYNHYFEKVISIDNNIKNLYEKTMKENSKGYTFADSFKLFSDNTSNSNIDFLKKKELQSNIKHSFIMPNGKYKEVIIFEDNSIFARTNTDTIVPFNLHESRPILQEIHNYAVRELLHNKPTVAKAFINALSKDETYRNFSTALIAINTYKEKENILKLSDFNIVNMLSNNNFKDFEALDDLMNVTVKKHDIRQYAHSIISNKYKYLYNESTYKIFEELFDAGVSKGLLDNSIGKKIAAFKDPESLNSALESFLSNFNNFDCEAMKVKAQNINADIVFSEGNLLVLKINNFEQSKYLGSSSWCISRDKHYFDSYTSDKASQYFVYNFNKDSKDNESMIGITIKNNQVSAAHLKDDKRLSDESLQNTLLQKINSATYEQNIERKVSLNNLSV